MKDLEKIITKELLRRVLPKETESLSDNFSFTINEDYIEFSDDGEMQFEYCIYKFAFRCKEWAFKYRYMIDSNISPTLKEVNNGIIGTSLIYNLNNMESKRFQSDTELGAIFKACEWVLKEQNNDTK